MKEQILAAVRRATSGATDVEPPRDYHRTLEDADVVAMLVDRLEDYRAEVHRIGASDLPNTIGRVLGQKRAASVVVPADLDAAGLTTVTCPVVRDDGSLDAARLDSVGAVITGCRVAIAQTGTIVLDGGEQQGRRIISLLPDLHLCLVRTDQVVGTLPEAIALMTPSSAMTWISGPSATSDIELQRVEGVHGPRTLVVLLIDG